MAYLMYSQSNDCHYRWPYGTWWVMGMYEGSNQGCPLSGLIVAQVLNKALKPLLKEMREYANKRWHEYRDPGDDGYGSVTHALGWMDDVTSAVPLVDLKFSVSG